MKKYIIYLLLISFSFIQCSKKTTDTAMDKAKATTEMTKELSWRSAAPAAAPARGIQLGEYNSFMLENGLEVIVVENHKLPRVSYQISLKHDAIVEGEEAGYTSMAGTLLPKGTKNRSKSEIDESIDFIGASLSASGTSMFGSSLVKHKDQLLDIMTDVLYNPTFPEEEFEKEKKRTLSGLATQKTDPNSMATNVSQILNFGASHPYGEIMTEESVDKMQLNTVKNYYEQYFRPNNAYLIIVGDVTPAQAKTTAQKYFGTWKAGEVPTHRYDMPAKPAGKRVAFVNKDAAVQSVIRVTYPVDLKPGTADVIPARVMNSILGGGIFSGRLMQNLREDKAYTYGARSSLNADKLMGSFAAFASVRNEVTDSSVYEFLYEMERMVTEPVSQADLDLSKASIAGSFSRSLESPQTIANFARNIRRYNLPNDYYETYLQKLDAVTVEDINAMSAKYIKPDNAYIVVVGSKDDVAEKLLRFDSDGKLEYYDAYGKEVKYDDIATPDNVSSQTVIEDYFAAIGGKDKLMGVQSLISNGSMDMMGQTANILMTKKAPGKMSLSVSMNGMTMQEIKVNGDKAMTSGMGQQQVMSKGDPGFDEMASQAVLFDVLNYMGEGYSLDLKGIEDVEGDKAYKLVVTGPSGKKTTEYYSLTSGLLLRDLSVNETPQGSQTVTNDYKDYKEVGGLLLPHRIVTTGQAPFPLEMKISSYEVNSKVTDDVFIIE